MAEFKFICNFGVNIDSRNILSEGYRSSVSLLQNQLMKIPTIEILLTIQYLDICVD